VIDNDNTCSEDECPRPWVCHLCEACEDHCLSPGGPDACWQNHETWRLTGYDDTLGVQSTIPVGVTPAPRPRWNAARS